MTNRLIRTDGSKGPIMSNTHKQLNARYDSIIDKIKVNEADLEVLSDSQDDTDSDWLRCIVFEQKQLYRELEYTQDKIAELNNYNG